MIKYGGNPDYHYYYPNIQCVSGSLNVSNSLIGKSAWHGIYCSNASPAISYCTLSGNNYDGINCVGGSPVISHNIFTNNGQYAGQIINATGALSSVHNSGEGNGVNGMLMTNCTITQNSGWTANLNFPYVIHSVTVDSGKVLTLAPGTLVKFSGVLTELIVKGRVEALGTADSNIVFTSLKDDSLGG